MRYRLPPRPCPVDDTPCTACTSPDYTGPGIVTDWPPGLSPRSLVVDWPQPARVAITVPLPPVAVAASTAPALPSTPPTATPAEDVATLTPRQRREQRAAQRRRQL